MENIKYIVPTKGTTRWELFTGYGVSEIKWTAVGLGIGIVFLLIVIGIQNLFFPFKAMAIEDVQYGMEYIETSNLDIVNVKRKIPRIIQTAIVLFFGAIVTFPNMKISNNMTFRESVNLSKNFAKVQQKFYFVKSKWY